MMLEGIVLSARYSKYVVLANDKEYLCSARGSVKKNKKRVLVGDYVLINDEEMIIEEIKERRSELKRPSMSNLDQLFLVFSLKEPEFSYHLAFKYLTYANKNGIKSYLILTKKDIYENDEELKEILDVFQKLHVEVYITSSLTKEGLEPLEDLFKGKISSFIGQSGVGKSSLINALNPSFNRDIGEYSLALGRGKHKTKEVVLFPYAGGYIADTPGFSSLDLELYKEDLAKFFPGFETHEECYFPDCLHISEPKCHIRELLENGDIPKIAYEEYLKLSAASIPYIRRYQK